MEIIPINATKTQVAGMILMATVSAYQLTYFLMILTNGPMLMEMELETEATPMMITTALMTT